MHDAEVRALRLAILVMLVLGACRWAWSTLRRPAEIPGSDVLPTLLAKSDSDLTDATERERPLAPAERVDPNRATAQQLDRLPGIGPRTAEAIVREREERGPFRGPDDLTRVRGIGPATVQRILSHLRIESHSVAMTTTGRPGPDGRTEPASPRRPTESKKPLVDVNHADPTALQSLPGVGPALARRIVEARDEKPFSSLEDLQRVRGIGPATLKRLKGLATVRRRRDDAAPDPPREWS